MKNEYLNQIFRILIFFSLHLDTIKRSPPLPKKEKKINLIRINNKTKYRSPINQASRYKSLVAVKRTLGMSEGEKREQRDGCNG